MAPTLRHILVGISTAPDKEAHSSELCAGDRMVASRALAFAERVGGEVRLLHVIDWLDERSLPRGAEVQRLVASRLGPALDALLAEAATRGVSCSVGYACGKPWYELMRAAHDWPADAILLGPRRDKLTVGDRLLHGSTTSRILRRAETPVCVVEPGSAWPPKRVLALCDGRASSGRVLETAAALARTLGADLYAARFVDYPGDMALHRLPDAERAIARYHRAERAAARADLERRTAAVEGDWTLLIEDDWVVRRCPELVRDHGIDMLVIGGVTQSRLARALLGTTAEQLLARLPITAWVVRPEDGRRPTTFDAPAARVASPGR